MNYQLVTRTKLRGSGEEPAGAVPQTGDQAGRPDAHLSPAGSAGPKASRRRDGPARRPPREPTWRVPGPLQRPQGDSRVTRDRGRSRLWPGLRTVASLPRKWGALRRSGTGDLTPVSEPAGSSCRNPGQRWKWLGQDPWPVLKGVRLGVCSEGQPHRTS